MPTIIDQYAYGSFLQDYVLEWLGDAYYSEVNSNSVVTRSFSDPSKYAVFDGYDVTYDVATDYITSGVVTAVAFYDSDYSTYPYATIQNLNLAATDLQYRIIDAGNGNLDPFFDLSASLIYDYSAISSSGAVEFEGGYNGDTIVGSSYDDGLYGYGGDDILAGYLGFDLINGGVGTDTALMTTYDGASANDYAFIAYGLDVYAVDKVERSVDLLVNVEFIDANGRTLTTTQIADFDPLAYVASYEDLSRVIGPNANDGLSRFLLNGIYEGREVQFDADQYLENFSDLATAFGSNEAAAATHFILSGRAEGRMAFDPLEYIASYADLGMAWGGLSIGDMIQTALGHWQGAGRFEGREVTFDSEQYLSNHSDLVVAFGVNSDAAAEHFIRYGRDEGRLASDPLDYVASHADLILAWGSLDAASLTETALGHYRSNGRFEARETEAFDVDRYLDNYADLRGAFLQTDGTYDEDAATLHFIAHGFEEGRTDEVV